MTKGKFFDELGEQLCVRTGQELGAWFAGDVLSSSVRPADLSGLSFAKEMVPSCAHAVSDRRSRASGAG